MNKFNRFYVSLLFTALFMAYTPMAQADMQQGYGNQATENRTYMPDVAPQQSSYGQKIGNKVLVGFANVATSPLEVPKNIINTMNQSNFFYGVFGGFLKGIVNTLGRAGCGIADLITFPLPTNPIAYPVYIWDDFDVDTSYGGVYRLNKSQKIVQPVAETPVAQPAPPPPKAAVVDRSSQYNQETSRKLDTVFKQEMQK